MNRKSVILLFFAIVSCASGLSAQSLMQLMKRPFNDIEGKWEENFQEDIELNYYNSDYCDYYVWIRNDRPYNLLPGKNRIFTIKKELQVGNMFKNSSEYNYFRGQFPEDFKIEIRSQELFE